MNKVARKMDTNLLYYVASVLNPRIQSSSIGTQMNAQDAGTIISQVLEFLKKEYPHEPSMSCVVDRPPGMSETMWRTLRKVQPSQRMLLSDIDGYLDAPPVSWSHHMIDDAQTRNGFSSGRRQMCLLSHLWQRQLRITCQFPQRR